MKIVVDWLDNANNAVPEERASVCDFRILIGRTNACDHLLDLGRRLYDHVTLSVYPIAEGIALDWWQIFGGRGEPYRLRSRRAGYVVPEILMQFDGAAFEFACQPCRYEDSAVRFLGADSELLDRRDAEAVLSDFIADVIERLNTHAVADSGLQRRWRRVRESLRQADEAAFCEAAGALGLDPYNVPADAAQTIQAAGALFAGEPLAEFLSGLNSAELSGALAWVREAERRPRASALLPAAGDLARRLGDDRAPRTGEKAWARGYRCAMGARRLLNIRQGERLRSIRDLADRLEAAPFEPAPPLRGLRALAGHDEGEVAIHLPEAPGRRRPEGELFTFARAVGETCANPPASRAVVNDLHLAPRQAANRAFATEFLAPIDEILSMQADRMPEDEIAAEFGVSEEVIEHQLANRRNIETVRNTA